ncbi:MAG: 3'(2'),5'-bisphosphate nucleotidase CysQ [Magnetococcales bacterium]|nr:3'(2'),5'-bisphosphate nucleotidase CysQ [Magnetococcales bacterium]
MFDPYSDLLLMEEAARLAGAAIMRHFQLGEPLSAHLRLMDKGHNNPLTQADLAADQCLRQTLLGNRPDYGWLSEEGTDDPVARMERQRVWIVDPMDGTKEFISGLPQFAVSIGLVERGSPVAACIFNPATRELFSAVRGGGAFCNGQRLQTSRNASLQGARCLASRSETKRGEWRSFAQALHITPMGSIAYKLALVASGRYDLTFTLTPKNEWDYCAGTLLLQEAGGRVSHKEGQPCLFNQKDPKVLSVLASNGPLHEPLLLSLEQTPLSPDRQAVA